MPFGITTARYDIRVRDGSNLLVGQIDDFMSAQFNLRFNKLSDWGIVLDADTPLATAISTPGAGVKITRTVLQEGAILGSSVLLSGPTRRIQRTKSGNVLKVSGKDDMIALASRQGYPVVTLAYKAQILATSGCLRFYDLGEGTGTSATDSKSAQTGTYSGGYTWGGHLIDDGLSSSVVFNGSSGKCAIPTTSLPTGNGTWSIDTWFTIGAYGAGNSTLAFMGAASSKQLAAIKLDSTGGMFADVFSAGTTHTSAVSIGALHYAVATWDGTNLRFYLDAALAGGPAAIGPLNVTLTNAGIGSFAGSEFFNGSQAAVGFYSSVLSPSQIAANYALGPSRFVASEADVRSGTAETIMRQYVDVNAISAVADSNGKSRVYPNLALVADGSRGSSVVGRSRFDKLVTKDGDGVLQKIAAASSPALGFKVVQSGTALQFQVYVPDDNTDDVKFSDDFGNVADFDYVLEAPDVESDGGNALVVGGGGEGVARLFLEANDANSITAWGRTEGFVDQRQTSDPTELTQAVDKALVESAEKRQFSATLAPVASMVYGIDYDLGDTVTVIVDGNAITDTIQGVNITLDTQGGETVTPVIGGPDANHLIALDPLILMRRDLKRTQTRLGALQRVF